MKNMCPLFHLSTYGNPINEQANERTHKTWPGRAVGLVSGSIRNSRWRSRMMDGTWGTNTIGDGYK